MNGRDALVSSMRLIAAGHAASNKRNAERRRRKVARGFKPSEQMERLLALRDRDPQAFATIGVGLRTAAGQYERTKQAAQPELQRDERSRRAAFADELGYADDWSDNNMRQNEAAYAARFPEPLSGDLADAPLGEGVD
jgi:hypothetical protein